MNTLDARGLKCPLPVLKARKAIKDVAPGGLLTVLSTDAGAPADFVHFCEVTGHQLVESTAAEGVYRFVIRKAAANMTTLDARGLKGPLSVLKARTAIKDVVPGGLLAVLSTDAGALKDFEHFCEESGHELVESTAAAGVYRFVIRKAAT